MARGVYPMACHPIVIQALAEDASLLGYVQVGPIVIVADVPAPQVWGAAICMVGLAARPR